MDGLGETITVAPHPLAPYPGTILGGTPCVPRAFNKSLSYFFLSTTLGRGVGRGRVTVQSGMLHFFPRKKLQESQAAYEFQEWAGWGLHTKKLFKIKFPDCVSINMNVSKAARFYF